MLWRRAQLTALYYIWGASKPNLTFRALAAVPEPFVSAFTWSPGCTSRVQATSKLCDKFAERLRQQNGNLTPSLRVRKLEKIQEQFGLVSVPSPRLQGTLVAAYTIAECLLQWRVELTPLERVRIKFESELAQFTYSWSIITGCDHFFATVMSKRKLQKVGTCMRQILTANGHINFTTHSNACNSKSASNGLKRCAYFFVFCHFQPLRCLQEVAMPGIPIVISLNYSLSTIDPWQSRS